MTRIEEEKKTVGQMVDIYCKGHHHTQEGLCEECSALLDYAHARLDHCKFGEKKPTCKVCPIHCYKPEMRERMKNAMRYAGPRMMWHHPVSAIKHLMREIRANNENKN